MSPGDWKTASSAAEVVQALSTHRLLPVYDILLERGLVRADIGPIAASLSEKAKKKAADQARVEELVLQAASDAGVDLLVLKGALLGRLVYSSPDVRARNDLDILVRPESVSQAGEILRELGYSAKHPVPSGIPLTQQSFVGDVFGIQHGVDVHWDLSQRSVLKNRIPFHDLWERRTAVPGLPENSFGVSLVDAILHCAMHYFAHFRGQVLVDQWILDVDLIWRRLNDSERAQACDLAGVYRVSCLLGAALACSAETFGTPVEEETVMRLAEQGKSDRARRLLDNPQLGATELLKSAWEEPGRGDGVRLLFRTFFPTRAYMRRMWPGYSRSALPIAYLKRLLRR